MYFDIITTIDTGRLEVLSYSSDKMIKYGQIVSILVRNKPYMGICITKNDVVHENESGGVLSKPKDFDIKPIEEILPIILPAESLDLIFKTHAYSWNKISSIVSAVLQPFSYILKQIPTIAKSFKDELIDMNGLEGKLNSNKFNIYNESQTNLPLRIMYLIRNTINDFQNQNLNPNGQILILFPDNATLNSLELEITKIINALSNELQIDINLDKYTSENSIVSNRKTIYNIINANKLQIIFATRSGIFLPFKTLIQTLLIDESSNNYIQEQNSLYFDSRDISYVLSQIWKSDLAWISHFPSSRSLAFNQVEETIKFDQIETQKEFQKVNIQICEKNNIFDDSHLYSASTENLIEQNDGPVLFIHARRGNFRITQCQTCRHIWHCPDCSASLITYKDSFKKLDLICHHCQHKYEYPLVCPECKGTELSSYSSGIDDLNENLSLTYPNKSIFKIDTSTNKQFKQFEHDLEQNKTESPFFLTTKIFDPRIPYQSFKSIIIIQAQNLAIGTDYLTTEEIYLSVFNLYLKLTETNTDFSKADSPISLIFDTTNPELEILQKFQSINGVLIDKTSIYEEILNLYSKTIAQELTVREKFNLPPYHNLLLLSANGKNHEKLKENVFTLYKWLKEVTKSLQPLLEITPPYPAKLLKRKGYFTYHLLLKYPKNFKQIKELDKILKPMINDMHLQARLNPRHVF